MRSRHRHIAIEGPIGAGKTTLALHLAALLGAEPLLEKPEDNPFLERFYDDVAGYAFQAQLFFLFQRVRQLQAAQQPGFFSNGVVSDFLLDKDALFARLNLSDDEYPLYRQMYQQVSQQTPAPDLVIWLQAGPASLLKRVRRRGIGMEQRISIGYLERLSGAYVDFFGHYTAAPVLAIDTEGIDPTAEPFATRLAEAMARFNAPRGVFLLGEDAIPRPMTH